MCVGNAQADWQVSGNVRPAAEEAKKVRRRMRDLVVYLWAVSERFHCGTCPFQPISARFDCMRWYTARESAIAAVGTGVVAPLPCRVDRELNCAEATDTLDKRLGNGALPPLRCFLLPVVSPFRNFAHA